MKRTIVALTCLVSMSAFAGETIREKILNTHIQSSQNRNCNINVSQTDSSIKIAVHVGDDALEFTTQDSDSAQAVLRDDSSAQVVDVTVRRTEDENGDISVQIRRLVIDGSKVEVSQLKRGITGRMNVLKTLSCSI